MQLDSPELQVVSHCNVETNTECLAPLSVKSPGTVSVTVVCLPKEPVSRIWVAGMSLVHALQNCAVGSSSMPTNLCATAILCELKALKALKGQKGQKWTRLLV